MSRRNRGREVVVKIESLSDKGEGIAPLEGLEGSVELPFTAPGDEVAAKLLRKRGGVYSAELLELITPSPLRVTPKCTHFGVCGGCQLQMLPYEKQKELKEGALRALFGDGVKIHPIKAPEELWHYRNKMEFTFSENREGERFLGLMLKNGKGRVFHLSECQIAHPVAVKLLKAVRSWWNEEKLTAFRPRIGEGTLRTLTIRTTTKSQVMVILTVSGRAEDAPKEKQLASFVKAIQEVFETASIFLRIHQAIKGQPTRLYDMHLAGPEMIEEELLGGSFSISPESFFQPNSKQAEELYERALELAHLTGKEEVWDLFCGTGTIALLAAKKAKSVVGVEISREAILDAKENAKRNGIENVSFLAGESGQFLVASEKAPDVLFCDPPRVGLGKETIASILRIRPKRFIYISCNPKTQAADCRELVQGGYHLVELQPVDQFPQTHHLENIALLCID